MNTQTINKSILKSLGIIVFVITITILPSNTEAANKSGFYALKETAPKETVVNQPPVVKGPGFYSLTGSYATVDSSYTTNSNASNTDNLTPVIYSITPDEKESGSKETTVAIHGNNFNKNSVARWNSSPRHTIYISPTELAINLSQEDLSGEGEYLITVFNKAPGGGYSNSVIFTLGGEAMGGGIEDSNGSDLAGNALFGAGGFLPFSFLDWLMFAILVLILVIIWRKIYVSRQERQAPLKHA